MGPDNGEKPMREAFHFHCPTCSTPLRVKDPLSLGRQARCPECHHSLVVSESNGEFRVSVGDSPVDPVSVGPPPVPAAATSAQAAAQGTGEPQEAASTSAGLTKTAARSKPRGIKLPPRSSLWRSGPLLAGLLLAGMLGTVFVWYTIFGGRKPETSHEVVVAPPSNEGAGAPEDPASHAAGPEHQRSAEDSLHGISEILTRRLALEGAFPSGVVQSNELDIERRLSWLAALADLMESHPSVTWDKPWDDPVNDGFVRRRLLEFQNPAIAILTGADGYPATHFVGVAGVGPDGPHLDATDPRAGIFAYDRRTRLEDIHDGASNTWLVLGVQARLGSWAAGGNPTVRSLTHEPYVNGQDGFGTGQADSMMVLLADGRVQVVSASADPQVLRAMATVADGQPASEEGPGGIAPNTAKPVAIVVDDHGAMETSFADDPPLEPEFAPEDLGRKVDPVVALQQPIVRFELSSARPLADLLPGLAELVGVPIRIDPEADVKPSSLKTPIQLRLQNTTIGAILEGALKPAGLTYQVEGDHLRIVPRE